MPILAALRESLYQSGQRIDESGFIVQGSEFVGLENYTAIFSGETGERFWNAFYNTTFFTVACVVLETILGVAMALVMHKAFKGRGIVRASILVPWAIPTVVSALLWKWIFQADGVANEMLGHADPVVHRGLAVGAVGHHRRHLEDRAVHRAAGARGPADDPGRGLRGGQGRRRQGVVDVLAHHACRW